MTEASHEGESEATGLGVPGPVFALTGEADAVSRARRWVTDCLAAAELDHVAGEAALVASELATNALLHGRQPVFLTLDCPPGRVRMEVKDANPAPPLRSSGAREGMTGRGLHVVEGIAADWGVEALPEGKSVWAELLTDSAEECIPVVVSADPEELLAAWDLEADPAESAREIQSVFTVRLGDVPTELLLSAKAHVEGLVREFALAASGARSGATPEVPPHLAELLETVVERFAEPRLAIKRQALAAADAGLDHVTLELNLPPSAADAGEEYLRALDQADNYCRAARLLTLESPPRHRVFRHWYVEELVSQLRRAAAGADPSTLTTHQTFEQRLLAEVDAVATAGRNAERTARLSSLAVALSSASSLKVVGEAILREGVAAMGASTGELLLSVDDPRIHVTRTIDRDGTVVDEFGSEPPGSERPVDMALRTGQPVWVESREEHDQRFPEFAAADPDTVSLCALPLALAERRLGALRLSFVGEHLFDNDERGFALALAAQTAQALDRALMYHQRVDAARKLQRSLLPPTLPSIPGVDIAAHYDTAEPLELGGDFYDMVGDGLDWTLLIGDVRGKGVGAATLTSLARHTVRAGALRQLSPTQILHLLNDAFLREGSPEDFCTGICGRLSVEEGSAKLVLAGGGHPPLFVLRTGGAVEQIACGGMLIGAFSDAWFTTRTVDLHTGDLLFLCTDGVTEARRDGQLFGTEGVESLLADAKGQSAGWVVKHVHEAVEDFQVGQRDDTAMLALRLLPEDD